MVVLSTSDWLLFKPCRVIMSKLRLGIQSTNLSIGSAVRKKFLRLYIILKHQKSHFLLEFLFNGKFYSFKFSTHKLNLQRGPLITILIMVVRPFTGGLCCIATKLIKKPKDYKKDFVGAWGNSHFLLKYVLLELLLIFILEFSSFK